MTRSRYSLRLSELPSDLGRIGSRHGPVRSGAVIRTTQRTIPEHGSAERPMTLACGCDAEEKVSSSIRSFGECVWLSGGASPAPLVGRGGLAMQAAAGARGAA